VRGLASQPSQPAPNRTGYQSPHASLDFTCHGGTARASLLPHPVTTRIWLQALWRVHDQLSSGLRVM